MSLVYVKSTGRSVRLAWIEGGEDGEQHDVGPQKPLLGLQFLPDGRESRGGTGPDADFERTSLSAAGQSRDWEQEQKMREDGAPARTDSSYWSFAPQGGLRAGAVAGGHMELE